MTTHPMPRIAPRRPGWASLTLLIAALAALVLTGLAAAAGLIAAAPGPALLTAGVLALAGWLVHAATTTPLPLLLGLAVLAAVAPWLLLLAVLACLALARGGLR